MSSAPRLTYVWWLVSNASGIVALVLVSLSVLLGLAMASRVLRSPAWRRTAISLHEHVALAALAAIAAHGLALLGDRWLKPGWTGITIPFALAYRPVATGLGIIAGYLAVVLGPSFYLRRRLGARRWRQAHRATVLVWALGVVHALGAGTDAGRPWLRIVALFPAVPAAYLLAIRALSRRVPRDRRPSVPRSARSREARPGTSRPHPEPTRP